MGALHNGVKLSWSDVLALRNICDDLNEQIKSENFVLEISNLYMVIFLRRSLEKRLITVSINLHKNKSSDMDDRPPSEHLTQVTSILNQFAKPNPKEYLPKLPRDGNRESHYRNAHRESTLVFDLLDQQPRYIATFIDKVDKKLPEFYCVANYIGFNNELAHGVEAAADIFLMPSLFEPCGLNQIYSLKYDTLPIVRLTGGLVDTIVDGVNGFTFFDFTARHFFDAVRRAIDVYRRHPDRWKQMMVTTMDQDFSWEKSAEKYLAVYTKTLACAGTFIKPD